MPANRAAAYLLSEQLAEAEQLAEKIEESVTENKLEGLIDVDFTSQYVELTLKGALLFDSGKAEIRSDAIPVLEKVGGRQWQWHRR